MIYVTEWQRLADARECVMADGRSKDQAEADICRATADRSVRSRYRPRRHATKSFTWKTTLDGKDVDIPVNLKPKHLDWEQSRPLKPWMVQGRIPGLWHLEWLELSRTDVTKVLCNPERRDPPIQYVSGVTPASTSGQAIENEERIVDPRSGARPQKPKIAGATRRRGARPKKFEQTKDALRNDIQQGRLTVPKLEEMLEKDLSTNYGVSRDTARRARNTVLSEFVEIFDAHQTPTNDK